MALLFDLDGTLVDSDADHLRAFQKVFAPFAITLDRALYTSHIMGASNAMIGERFLAHLAQEERAAVLDAKEEAYRDGLGALEATRGAAELLAYAQTSALPCAVVTNAPRANAEKVLAAIGLAERLPIVVIGGELARAKPDPLPYLTALELTGALAARSVAFEEFAFGRARRGRRRSRGRWNHDRLAGSAPRRGGGGVRRRGLRGSAHLRIDCGAQAGLGRNSRRS